jgi:hypothetical protein
MSRSLRRHQAARARVRKARILATRGAYWYWPSYQFWKPINRSMMNEPGWWVHEFMTVPARRAEKRFEHAVAHGLDPDGVVWPDNRKPHKYFW